VFADLKEYDLIVIGTGSAMGIAEAFIQRNTNAKVAVVDKDDPGGICLTRGCIPSKILLYPAEILRTIERAGRFGIDAKIGRIDFGMVMRRMRTLIDKDIDKIREGLSHSPNIAYYPKVAQFVAPYTLEVQGETLHSDMIFLCTGSKPKIPPIKGIETVGYHTNISALRITELPKSIVIVGGGYIAAEYGFFFSAMGSDVTIIGRNPKFLPQVEQEVSTLVKDELQLNMQIFTNHEVREVLKTSTNKKLVIAYDREKGEKLEVATDEILIASGRAPNTDILHPEKGGIKIDERGWIQVDEFLETSQPNIWALGDANGRYQFKHVANHEARVVYYNAILKKRVKVDYHAIPYAVFTYPEIAGVGFGEKEAIEKFSKEKVLIGFHRYEDTAKGEAMDVKKYFVKVILERDSMKILGAHIIGPYASVLIQEIINLMYTPQQSADPITGGMHIHPSLSEVVERAFSSLMTLDQYHHTISHQHNVQE